MLMLVQMLVEHLVCTANRFVLLVFLIVSWVVYVVTGRAMTYGSANPFAVQVFLIASWVVYVVGGRTMTHWSTNPFLVQMF